ncbi:MAG TPA: hypothetical protein VIF62_28975 [Labilithrix sp.]|jgi:hypothetical protein
MTTPLSPPKWVGQTLRYRTRPRPKRAFHTVLDAAEMLSEGSSTVAKLEAENGALSLRVSIDLRRGRMEDVVEHDRAMTIRRLERRVAGVEGGASREEIVDFTSQTHMIPKNTYVDVSAPFLLGGSPFDGQSRAIYTWICDRFIAKVYYESRGKKMIDVPAGRFEAHEVVMYPDLNDWVSLPSIITKLSKPFLPKYHMWYETAAPHRLVFFEGPHGPPGAPEIVLELAGHEGA